MEQLEVIL